MIDFSCQTDFCDYSNDSYLNIFYCSTYNGCEVSTHCDLVEKYQQINNTNDTKRIRNAVEDIPNIKMEIVDDYNIEMTELKGEVIQTVGLKSDYEDNIVIEEEVLDDSFYSYHKEDSKIDDFTEESYEIQESSVKYEDYLDIENEPILKCRSCSAKVFGKKNLVEHMKVDHMPLPLDLICDLCSIAFPLAYQLQVHKEMVHGETGYINCAFCDKLFAQTADYIKHIQTCHRTLTVTSRQKKDSPQIQKKKKISPKIKIPNYRLVNGEKCYDCDMCSKYFKSPTVYYNHKLGHIKPHKCNLCTKSFPHKTALTLHLTSHSDKRPYSCAFCTSSFRNKNLRDDHLRLVHLMRVPSNKTNKPGKCYICYDTFQQLSDLREHMNTHPKDTPFACNLCPKKFRNHIILKNHRINVHFPDQSKYRCKICKLTVTSNSKMVLHMRSHTGEKPFSCSRCQAKFASNSGLTAHVKAVHGVYVKNVENDGTVSYKLIKYKRQQRKKVCKLTDDDDFDDLEVNKDEFETEIVFC